MNRLVIGVVLSLSVLSTPIGTAIAQQSTTGLKPFQDIRVTLDGAEYRLAFRPYPEPRRVDLSAQVTEAHPPLAPARAFWRALASGKDYDAVAAHTRTVAGQPAPRPADEKGHMEVARNILAGGVLLFGEIVYGEYRIFIYRYPNSIPRNLGLPVRRFGERYFVVTDLVEADPLAKRLSALRWDVDRLAREHPRQ